MISLEQIKLLETKVESALNRIIELQDINSKLQTENMDLQTEVELLQEQCTRFEQDEAKIEQGILSVLERLNTVEDTVRQSTGKVVTEQVIEPTPETLSSQPEQVIEPTPETPSSQPKPSLTTTNTAQTLIDDVPDKQATGMLNYAEKSAQLDIF